MNELDDVQRKLLTDRVVAIFGPLDMPLAERVAGQMLYLEELDATKEITLSLSTPGGSIPAGLEVLSAIAGLGPPLRTVCLERCGGIATLLLAAGARGSRTARKGSRISIDELSPGGLTNAPLEPLRKKLLALFSTFTGQSEERIAQDAALGLELTAEGARRYGLIDEVFERPADS